MSNNTQDLISNIKADDAKRADQSIPIQNDLPAQAILEKCLDIEDCTEQTYEKIMDLDKTIPLLLDKINILEKNLNNNLSAINLINRKIAELNDNIHNVYNCVNEKTTLIYQTIESIDFSEETVELNDTINDSFDELEAVIVDLLDDRLSTLDSKVDIILKDDSADEALKFVKKFHESNVKMFNKLESRIDYIEAQIDNGVNTISPKIDKIDNHDIYNEINYINKNILKNNYSDKLAAINTKLESALDLLLEIKNSDKKDKDLENRVKSIENLIRTIVNSLGKG